MKGPLELVEAKLDHSGAAAPSIVAGIENVAHRAVELVGILLVIIFTKTSGAVSSRNIG